MGRLKKDHSGYSSHGLWKKYNALAAPEPLGHVKSKKDTRRWCKGKKGVEHALQRRFYYSWGGKRTSWIRTHCTVCQKELGFKNNTHIPLVIDIDEYENTAYPIQVKVNGKALPIPSEWFRGDFCVYCNSFDCVTQRR